MEKLLSKSKTSPKPTPKLASLSKEPEAEEKIPELTKPIPVYVKSAADGRLFAPFLPDPNDPDGTRILMFIDITYPLSVLKRKVMSEIKYLKREWDLRQKRKERYLDDPTYCEVKGLIEKGLKKPVEIFRRLYPEYRDFNFTKDYVTNPEYSRKPSHYGAWRAYKKIERLVKRVESRQG